MTQAPDAQVIIVGAGPVGLTLANLLGCEGVRVLVLERNADTVPEPRAIALDGESLRTLQAAGLAHAVIPTLREGFVADYLNGDGVELFHMDLTPRPYGFCLQNSFDQPTLERQLLAGLERFDSVQLHFRTEFLDFTQHDNLVEVRVRASDGRELHLCSDYLVACDGGRSSVRRELGIAMEGDRLPQRWLVVDTVDDYLIDEPQCRFYCDPERPAMTMLRPRGERRWEWMLGDEESDEEMLADARIDELLAEHTDPARVRVYRKCVYGFSAVVAECFSEGRVFLAGDAAHMTPPFAGQGLNAGVRDARNLSWKLVQVLRGQMPDSLLRSYNLERHDAAREVVDLAVGLGEQIQPTNPAAARARDELFAELNRDEDAARAFRDDAVAPLFDVRLRQGWLAEDNPAGRLLPQPAIESPDGLVLLDDTLCSGFVALLPRGIEVPPTFLEHPLWKRLRPELLARPTCLDGFVAEASTHVILVRPDRFVLASLPCDGPSACGEKGGAILDNLQARLEAA